MSASSLLIRPARTPDELRTYVEGYVQVAQSFSPDLLPQDMAARRLDRLTTLPGFRSEQVRCASRDGEYVGGYRIMERRLRVGTARLLTGCIGGVYTHAHARKQGVASALMQDAMTYAQTHGYALLLLDGIPKFYHRYGYCDVYDLSTLELDQEAILALPPGPYRVRQAQLADAPALLSLYERHASRASGSFERSREQQVHWQRHLEPEQLWLALDAAGGIRGYLFLFGAQARGPFFLAGTELWELVVDDWPATVALLQEQTRRAEAPCLYSVPPGSSVARWLVDHLEAGETSAWDWPVFGWAVREQTFRHRDAGWMACLVSLPAVLRAMLPEWQARWQRSLAHWSGEISFLVGEDSFTMRLDGPDLSLLDAPGSSAPPLVVTPQAFIQAIFGYRPIVSLIQPGEPPLSSDLVTVLSILFPLGEIWIAPSDWF
jgi:predicted N-acetyltransferase YhbS